MKKPRKDGESREICAFSTALGWMAIQGSSGRLEALTFGHASEDKALNALLGFPTLNLSIRRWNDPLIRRLQAYAEGERESFRDIAIDWRPYTAFQRQVMEACREIPWGGVISYAELARRAGHAGAARAVGRCMAANRVPLVVPCHRVVGADGRLCGYSGPGGLETKQRLLELEGACVPARTLRFPAGR